MSNSPSILVEYAARAKRCLLGVLLLSVVSQAGAQSEAGTITARELEVESRQIQTSSTSRLINIDAEPDVGSADLFIGGATAGEAFLVRADPGAQQVWYRRACVDCPGAEGVAAASLFDVLVDAAGVSTVSLEGMAGRVAVERWSRDGEHLWQRNFDGISFAPQLRPLTDGNVPLAFDDDTSNRVVVARINADGSVTTLRIFTPADGPLGSTNVNLGPFDARAGGQSVIGVSFVGPQFDYRIIALDQAGTISWSYDAGQFPVTGLRFLLSGAVATFQSAGFFNELRRVDAGGLGAPLASNVLLADVDFPGDDMIVMNANSLRRIGADGVLRWSVAGSFIHAVGIEAEHVLVGSMFGQSLRVARIGLDNGDPAGTLSIQLGEESQPGDGRVDALFATSDGRAHAISTYSVADFPFGQHDVSFVPPQFLNGFE